MRIRDLDNSGTTLNVFTDEQGDVYVTIFNFQHNKEFYVRIGGPGSGHSVPPEIRKHLLALAAEFEKYENCRNEEEAFEKYCKEKTKPQNL